MATPNDPTLRSWIDIPPTSDFPIQNLPFGVFETEEHGVRLGVAIGGYVLDLYAASQYGFFEDLDLQGKQPKVFRRRSLNRFIALGPAAWRAVRQRVSELLRHDNPTLRDHESAMRACLVRQREVTMRRPVKPRHYTLFAGSPASAAPEADTLPTGGHQLPLGRQGRADSVVVSGTAVAPPGTPYPAAPAPADAPASGRARPLDFGPGLAFVGGRNTLPGSPVPLAEAEEAIFGLVLLAQWSAPAPEEAAAGSWLSQAFVSSVSPWVVTLDALEPLRAAGPAQLPEPLPFLRPSGLHHFDVQLQGALLPAGAPAAGETVVTQANFREAYWSMAQQLAAQTSNGAALHVGDLHATGPTPDSPGSLWALSQAGTRPVVLNDGTTRTHLESGDTVTLRGYGEREGVRIGFGEVTGKVGAEVG